jgi:tRNA G10  N-methylase Trm11
MKETFGIDTFDAVIGNPPYQNSSGNKGSGNTLWNLFVDKSLGVWLKEKGLLVFVHPQGWRQINSKIGHIMKSKQIMYLNMNSVIEGKKVFNCSTTFDYYVMENTVIYTETLINDYKNVEYSYNLKEVKFIPNHNLDDVYKLIDDTVDDNGFMNDQSSYEVRKKWMSKKETNEFKYPCVYSINSKNVISIRWSKLNDKGHFGISKFIFSNGNGFHKDLNGEYGLTQWAYAFRCKNIDMDNIEKAFNNYRFQNIINSINLTSNKYNYNVLKMFKKDFWKEFV